MAGEYEPRHRSGPLAGSRAPARGRRRRPVGAWVVLGVGNPGSSRLRRFDPGLDAVAPVGLAAGATPVSLDLLDSMFEWDGLFATRLGEVIGSDRLQLFQRFALGLVRTPPPHRPRPSARTRRASSAASCTVNVRPSTAL